MPENNNQIIVPEVQKLPLPSRLQKGLAIAGAVTSLASGMVAREAVFSPDKASAAMECTTTVENGVTTTECSEESSSANGTPTPTDTVPNQPKAPDEASAGKKPPKTGKNDGHKGSKGKQKENNSEKDFPGYNMEDSSFTDGNGCFITAAASSLRRETGNSNITPKKIFYPELRSKWSPTAGVKQGLLFSALPAMAARHNVKVWETGFEGALEAKKSGDEVMLLAEPGHFTSVGHYMAVRGVTKNGRKLIVDDPNGRGKYGDSERKSGWSGKELKRAGVIDYRVLHLNR